MAGGSPPGQSPDLRTSVLETPCPYVWTSKEMRPQELLKPSHGGAVEEVRQINLREAWQEKASLGPRG